MKIKFKDILIMSFQFIGGLIIFLLVLNSDLMWITGRAIFIGNFIYYSFLWLGILILVFIFISMIIKFEFKFKKR